MKFQKLHQSSKSLRLQVHPEDKNELDLLNRIKSAQYANDLEKDQWDDEVYRQALIYAPSMVITEADLTEDNILVISGQTI